MRAHGVVAQPSGQAIQDHVFQRFLLFERTPLAEIIPAMSEKARVGNRSEETGPVAVNLLEVKRAHHPFFL